MRILIDTHIAIWLINESSDLSRNLRERITEYGNQVYISIESLHELVIKVKLKNITLKQPVSAFVDKLEKEYGIKILAVNKTHVFELDTLSLKHGHNDPFDHIIISQAINDKLILISLDQNFPFYENQGLKLLNK
jgi:PIN domain nuclease of toxin-antitoxin system